MENKQEKLSYFIPQHTYCMGIKAVTCLLFVIVFLYLYCVVCNAIRFSVELVKSPGVHVSCYILDVYYSTQDHRVRPNLHKRNTNLSGFYWDNYAIFFFENQGVWKMLWKLYLNCTFFRFPAFTSVIGGGRLIKLWTCWARGPGFKSRSLYLNFRDLVSPSN